MLGLTKQNKWDLSAESFLAHWGETDLLQRCLTDPSLRNILACVEWTAQSPYGTLGWFTTCKQALLNYYIQQTHSLKPGIREGRLIQLSGSFLKGIISNS